MFINFKALHVKLDYPTRQFLLFFVYEKRVPGAISMDFNIKDFQDKTWKEILNKSAVVLKFEA